MRACINNQQIRHHNKCVILELLYRQKRANKSTLARLAQISIPAVSNILQELESEKRVVNIDDESQTRGHSSGTWLIAPEGDWTLCLNVTPTSIECQVANACLSPKGEFEYLQIDAPTPQALLSEIEKCWHRHRKLWPDRTINLALAIHGQVDPVTGVSQTMPQAPWTTPVEVKYLLEEKLGIRVMVDNDCVMLALAENMLDRDGIISRQAVIAENIPGGFPSMQTLCRSMEDSGRIMRGRFVEGLGGAQFAERLTIDRLRDLATQATQTRHYTPVALSANDPANVWGNLLPWPAHPATLVPTRRAGALVVVSGGKLLLYLAQGGKKMLVWQEKEELLAPEVFHALTTALRREPRLRFTLTEVNDLPVRQTPMFTLLREAGFSSSPQGLDWG